jgi:hypothetical protein
MLHLDPDQRPSAQQLLQIPLLNLRLREKQLKDRYADIKQREEQMRKK